MLITPNKSKASSIAAIVSLLYIPFGILLLLADGALGLLIIRKIACKYE